MSSFNSYIANNMNKKYKFYNIISNDRKFTYIIINLKNF